jgi:DNA polymerase V
MLSAARAGFPSPADDHIEKRLDLNDLLIADKASSFLVRAKGDSMLRAGIHDGDLLVVDRSLNATDGRVIIAVVEGNFAVKRLRRKGARVWLEAADERFAPTEIADEESAVCGVHRVPKVKDSGTLPTHEHNDVARSRVKVTRVV